MQLKGTAKLLRIFIGELDKVDRKPLYEEILFLCRKTGLAGATITRGIMSYGASSIIHKTKILELSADLPIIIEIVDEEQKIINFLPQLDILIEKSGGGALITMENVEIIKYLHAK